MNSMTDEPRVVTKRGEHFDLMSRHVAHVYLVADQLGIDKFLSGMWSITAYDGAGSHYMHARTAQRGIAKGTKRIQRAYQQRLSNPSRIILVDPEATS